MTTAGRGARRALSTLTLIIAALLALSASAQAAAPANDDFSSAQALTPTFTAEASGTNFEATKEAGEPDHAGNAGGHSVWFKWTPASSGPVAIKGFACFGELKPLVAVYTGSAVNALTSVADNGNPFSAECFFGEPSAAEFEAQASTTYWIAVDGRNGTQGSFNLKLEGAPANDDFADAQAVTPASSSTLYTNRLASKQAEEPDHAGDPGGHSVWFKWTPSASEAARISTCSGFSNLDALLAVYTGTELGNLTKVASNDDGPGKSYASCRPTDSEVAIDVTAGTTYWIAVDGSQGTVGRFNLQIQVHPSNDDFGSPAVLSSGFPVNYSGNNELATKQSGEPDHAGNVGGHSVWLSWTPAEDTRVRVSACSTEASLDTLLAVYTGTELANLTEVASNSVGSNSGCTVGSEVVFNATENTTYMIAVDGKDGDEGHFYLSIERPPANDDFANAQPLGELPISTSGSNRVASKETGEPNHAGDPGGSSVWFSWTPAESGPVTISTCPYLETSPDTLLGVYTGNEVGNLTEVASNDDSPAACKEMGSEVEIQAKAGTTYRIAVDSKDGSEGIFSLDLQEGGAPSNDAFATPWVLPSFPIAPGGSTVGATKEPGEPNHAGNAGGHSVWFSWTPEDSGPVDLSVCGERPGVDTLLAVYTGTELANLTEVASNDDSGTMAPDGRCEESTGNSEVVFVAKAGTTYRIAVDTKASEGRFALDLERAPANDDFAEAHALEAGLPAYGGGMTKLATKQSGEPDHAGNAGGHSVWFSWTPEKTESVSVSTCTHKTSLDTLLGVYTGSEVGSLTEVAGNDDGQAGKSCHATDSEAEFTATAGTTYWIAVDGKEGSTGSFQLFLEGVAPNDDFGKAQPLGAMLPTAWQFGSNRFATKQVGEPDHAGNAGGSSVWFKWTAPRTGTVSVDTCGSSFDSLLAVYTGAKLESLTPVASNDDGSGGCAPQSRVSFEAVANTVYRIAVDGKDGAQGPLELHVDSRPKNDDFENADVIPGSLGWYWPGYNVLATRQAGEPGDPSGHTVWYSWTPQKSWAVELDACASFEPQVAVYTGSAVNALTPISTADVGSGECEEGRSVAFTTVPGTTYRIAVDGAGGNEGHFELHLHGTRTEAVTHTLSVSRAGSGSGSISSSPTGISCGAICSHDFAAGAEVTLTATPASGSVFAGWSGGGCSGTGSCQLTLNADAAVTATFALAPSEGGGGTVPPPPPPAPKPKPHKCKRGYKKKIVHGKRRCVKKKKHRRHHG